MRRKLLSLLVLLITAVSCAWADSYLYLVVGEMYHDNDLDEDVVPATLMYGEVPEGKPYYNGGSWNVNGYDDDFKERCRTISVDESCKKFDGNSLTDLFRGWYILTAINDLKNLKTSNVGNMSGTFHSCHSLTTLDLSGWNTSKVRDMSNMFAYCGDLTTLTLGSGWNTSNVTTMSNMFVNCRNLTTLDPSGWNTSKVTKMSNMFEDCGNLTTLNLSSWNTSNVTNMSYMFASCSKLTTLTLGSGWNTSNVTTMSNMFRGCSGLTTLDLSGWNTAKVKEISGMFDRCSNLTTLNLSSMTTFNVTAISYMFSDCQELKTIYVGDGWNTESVTDNGNNMFYHCKKLPGWNCDNPVTDVSMATTTDKGGYLTIATYNLTAKQGATGEYWATFYSEMSNYQASAGTQVFAVKLTDTEITMIQITDGIVKSGEGVVLKNTSGSSITMTPTDEAGTGNYSDNSLVGTKIAISNPGNAYVLNKGNAGIGFYKLKDTGTIGANKAYLTYSGGGDARESFGFGNTTSINDVRGQKEEVRGEYYDLQGRRVSQPTRGLYIVNGKKVVIK